MRYCPACDAEFEDHLQSCPDDGIKLLSIDAYQAELARQGRRPVDFASLESVAMFDDRFSATEVALGLQDEGIEVSLVSTRGGVMGSIAGGAPAAWMLVVPSSQAAEARALAAEWQPALAGAAAEGEAAAVAEEAAGEATL